MPVVEDGGENWDAGQAVKEVTEGQVQEEQGGRAPQPGELCPVPGGVYCVQVDRVAERAVWCSL